MRFRTIRTRAQSTGQCGPPRVRSTVIWTLAMTITLAAAGCATAPRQADSPAPPAATRDDPRSAGADQAPSVSTRTDFHEKATERQKFQVHIDFGRAFEAQGNIDAALVEYQDALKVVENKRRGSFRAADEALAHRRMGGAMDRQGRFAQAETHYKNALKISPNDAKAWNDAGYSYYLQGRWADAEQALKTAVRLAPNDERIRTNLGLTLAAEGRTTEALPLLSQSNGEAIGHINLGYLLAASGQLDLARKQYASALALRPDLTVARRALAQIDHKQALTQSAGVHPTPPAQGMRPTTAHPIDPSVKQASTATVKVPPPLPKRVLPEARAPIAVERQAPRAPASIREPAPIPPPRPV
jgi:tetratricopeptide (TPR) repeat protein